MFDKENEKIDIEKYTKSLYASGFKDAGVSEQLCSMFNIHKDWLDTCLVVLRAKENTIIEMTKLLETETDELKCAEYREKLEEAKLYFENIENGKTLMKDSAKELYAKLYYPEDVKKEPTMNILSSICGTLEPN